MGFFDNLFNRKATDGIPGVSMRESLVWILDKPGETIHDDEKYRINIDFVHSLGLKCDCVGWSELDLADPRVDEILDKIKEFCDKNGWRARGVYNREYYGYQSDWFELITSDFRDKTLNGRVNCECDGGGVTEVFNLRACNELRISPKQWSDLIFVPERFRDACIHSGIADVDFCWAEDKGKYRAEQYFHMYSDKTVGCVGTDREIGNKKTKLYRSAGGYLPRISEIFHEIQQVNLQDCYLRDGMPEGGIVHCFLPDTLSFVGRSVFLIHKSTAELLLRGNAITEKDLRPALVVDEIPGGYTAERGAAMPRPSGTYLRNSIADYESFVKSPRPVRAVSEKEALKLFKEAKAERKEDFGRAIPRSEAEVVAQTEYAPLLAYYKIANGGYLSDEYRFLDHATAVHENAELQSALLSEELIERRPDGVVFATAADGDRILLCKDGNVLRFGHEEPVSINEWMSLSQFVVDAIND